MRKQMKSSLAAVAFMLGAMAVSPIVAAQSIPTSYGPVSMQRNLPDPSGISTLYDELHFQQAVQSFVSR